MFTIYNLKDDKKNKFLTLEVKKAGLMSKEREKVAEECCPMHIENFKRKKKSFALAIQNF